MYHSVYMMQMFTISYASDISRFVRAVIGSVIEIVATLLVMSTSIIAITDDGCGNDVVKQHYA